MKDIFARKDLLRYMVISKLKASQKEMMLGYLWWILDPMLLMIVYWLLVRIIFRRGTEDYPFFLICALVPWRAFSTSLTQAVTSISDKFALISAVNFPRILLPLVDVIANHIKMAFGLLVVVAFGFYYQAPMSFKIVYIILPFVLQFLLVCGLSLLVAVFGVYFRDLKNLIQFLLRVWLYLTPILYSIERVPDRFQSVFLGNPMACAIIFYRRAIMENSLPSWDIIARLVLESVILFCIGYVVFNKSEKNILKLL